MNINPVISLIAGEAIDNFLRVKLNGSGQAVLADAADLGKFIGTNLHDVAADPDDAATTEAAVQLKCCGMHYAVAADAIAVGGEFEAADDGKVKAVTGTALGVAYTASTADGDVIRVSYY